MRARSMTSGLYLLVVVGAFLTSSSVSGQSSRDRKNNSQLNEKELQSRAEKAEETLVKELHEIAGEFYKQGDREKSIAILERISQINPRTPGLKEQMKTIREEMLTDNPASVDVDTSKGWTAAVAEVEGGRPFRIAASGDFRVLFSATLSVNGISDEDPSKDVLSVAPFGALIGVIVSDGKPGEPFAVNNGLEMTSKKSGLLFLRANVPAGAKCTGKIKVQLSGGIRAANSR
ncbi:MAG: hypothetical protein KDA91_12285 [Planctomycetaceae bacterium]|nr:hypothetical protein [Planctomycetaceae bacterium]